MSHAGGLGFLGFLATGRTNSYGTNVRALWSVSQHNPQKRGAITQSWTSVFNHLRLPHQTSQHTTYEYSTTTTEKGVFINVPTAILTQDHLMGFETLQTYTYDDYYNPSRILTERFSGSSLQGSTDQHYSYHNTPSATDATYHIGRLTQEINTETWGGLSHTTTTHYTHYDNNLLKSMKLQGNATAWLTENMVYDAFGNLLSKTLRAIGYNDRSQGFTYSPDGRFLESATDLEGLTTTFSYHPNGTLEKETDPFTKSTSYSYDEWQRPQSVTDYLGNSSQISYGWDNFDLVERQDGADGSASLRVIDPWGRERFSGANMLNGQWRFTYSEYDVAGRQVVQSEPYAVASAHHYRNIHHTHGLRNSTQYDEYGRVRIQALATGKSISTTYRRGNPTTVVNDGFQEVSTTLDARGKIVQLNDPNGTIVYTYHPTGELLESNYDGHVVRVSYDGWGRKKSLSDPSAGEFSYTYDIFGQLREENTPWGTTNYGYDAQGKLNWKSQQGEHTHLHTSYVYDSTTKLLTREQTTDRWNNDSFVKTIAYDHYERPEVLTESNGWANFSQTLSYDRLGRIDEDRRSASASGAAEQRVVITHSYAANGQLYTLLANQKKVWELKADNARGQATQVGLGNGITKNNAFDALGFLESTRQGSAFSLDLNYNKKKGVLNSRIQQGHAKEVFTHDSRNRLTHVVQDSLQRNYRYDTYGRMAENSRVGEYHYTNPNNRYVLDSLYLNAHGKKFYDQNNRQTAKYNIDRKATQVHQHGQGIANFIYNASGARVHAFYGNEAEDWNERKYRKHYSTLFPAEIRVSTDPAASAGKTVFYLGGDGYTAAVALINGEDHYLHRDHLGSILAISNSSGTMVEERHFTPWGEVDYFAKNGVVQQSFEDALLPRGFTGHEHFEQVNSIHMNGRLYDPQLRRFTAPDNHIQDPFDTRSYDRKAYVWYNPLMASDPSGEIIQFIIMGAIAGAFNAAANGGNLGQILLGAVIGGVAGGLGAGIANLAAGGAFFGNAALSVTGFGAGFAVGFAGGFVGGFVGATLNGLAAGQNIGEALGGGFRAGVTAGVLAGLAAGIGAGVKAKKSGANFWDGTKDTPLVSSVNEITTKGVMPLEGATLETGDLSGLRRIDNVEIANTWDSVTNKRILSLSEELQPKATSFVNRVHNELNIKLRITDGYRSIQEQNALYAQGRTAPGKIVTHARGGQSLHNYGKAFDVVQIKNGVPIWEKLSNDIVNIASELGLEWGGHWNTFKDYPHFYIK